MEGPRISILTATYNRAELLKETLGVLRLEVDPQVAEVVLVDDGSSEEVYRKISEATGGMGFVRLIRKVSNTGCADARNVGVSHSKGDWILILDDDDLLMPGVLKAYIEAIETYPQVDVFYGDLLCLDEKMQKVMGLLPYFDFFRSPEGLLCLLVFGDFLPHPGAMVRKRVLQEIGGYNKALPRAEDYELWSRLAGSAGFKHLDRFTVKYRLNNCGLSARALRSGDLSAEREVLKGMLKRYSLERLFLWLDWSSPLARGRAAEVLGAMFFLLNAPEEAIGHLEGDLSGRDAWRRRFLLSSSLASLGKLDDAIRILEEVPEGQRHPKERALYYLLKRPNAQHLELIAREASRLSGHIRAEAIKEAVRHFGYHLTLLERAKCYRGQGLYSEALVLFKTVLQFDPKNAECLKELSLLERGLGGAG